MIRLAPGSVVANAFEITRVIGSGSMGTVYQAKVIETGVKVALKFPHPSFASSKSSVQRFMREANATIAIQSPHVVRTYAVAKLRRGMPVLVMEYVQGVDLADYIDHSEGPIPLGKAVVIIDQIAAGLAAAHAAGVIHRDLKPGNVLVKNIESQPIAKVFDFGLSVILTEESRLTYTGSAFGTPHYMAPEQIRDTKHVDERADIYALGVLAYELISGRWPFVGATAKDIWNDALYSDPWPLRTRRPDTPEELCAIVTQAMARDPSQRFSSANEVRKALEPLCHLDP